MRHEMLTQRALFCHRANTKRGTLSQHFVTRVVPPLGSGLSRWAELCIAINGAHARTQFRDVGGP